MTPILTWQCSTWIAPMLRAFVRSLPSAGSWVCAHCGSSITAHGADGTSACIFTIDSPGRNWSHSKHVVAVTFDGKLSISCASSGFAAPASDRDSGASAGISSSRESSGEQTLQRSKALYWRARGIEGEGEQSCGCDPRASYVCDAHLNDFLTWTPAP